MIPADGCGYLLGFAPWPSLFPETGTTPAPVRHSRAKLSTVENGGKRARGISICSGATRRLRQLLQRAYFAKKGGSRNGWPRDSRRIPVRRPRTATKGRVSCGCRGFSPQGNQHGGGVHSSWPPRQGTLPFPLPSSKSMKRTANANGGSGQRNAARIKYDVVLARAVLPGKTPCA